MTLPYKIDGDTVTFQRYNGERFVMRWVIKGDRSAIDPGRLPRWRPYPYVIKQFTRQQ